MAALTTENLTELNGRVAVDREKPEDVAQRLPHRERPALDPELRPRTRDARRVAGSAVAMAAGAVTRRARRSRSAHLQRR